MTGTTVEITNQQALWDEQHTLRGSDDGLEGCHLVDTPNESAVTFNSLLVAEATIAEVGSANGRDARYWALNGHTVHCLDFSQVALDQLVEHASRQGLDKRIFPLYFDANAGALPDELGYNINGFYARSALHIDDDKLMSLLNDVHNRLAVGSIVLIEGKGTQDPKIARSLHLGNGLAVDPEENGHLRRAWTPEALEKICDFFGWYAIRRDIIGEEWAGTDASFLRLVARKS